MPIVVAPTGTKLRVVKIATDERTKKHLANLGITVNSVISILSSSGGGVICLVLDGRLAIDRELATKIFVA